MSSLITIYKLIKRIKTLHQCYLEYIKGAFDHISKNQLIKICIKLGLLKCLVY